MIRTLFTATVAAVTLTAGMAASADDTELLVGPTVTPATNRPNILFILDTSGSMNSDVSSNYDKNGTYSGACNEDRIYWKVPDSSTTDVPPSCNTRQWVHKDAFKCQAALEFMDDPLKGNGKTFRMRAARWQTEAGPKTWSTSLYSGTNDSRRLGDNWVECEEDRGKHGDGTNLSKLWATNNTSSSSTRGPWNALPNNEISWSSRQQVIFYTGKYINWYNNPTSVSSRLEVMQQVVKQVLNGTAGVNVGLMRYSSDADGGMVVNEMQPIETGAAALTSQLMTWEPSGNTPLSETLYEAAQYLRGKSVDYGIDSRIPTGVFPSVSSSRTGSGNSLYDSPMDENCQKTYIVYLTDGLPTSDTNANAKIRALTGVSPCSGGDSDGDCLVDLSRYLYETDLRTDVAGDQTVKSYWIGFGDVGNDETGAALLTATAEAGGGRFFGAQDTPQLISALSTIIDEISFDSKSFTAPTVAVNAFNRTQNLNDLYVSVFRPSAAYRWLGNVKKYRLKPDGTIIDSKGADAVDETTGLIKDTAQSFWSAAVDGNEAEKGGAASKLTNPSSRTIYTNLTSESGVLSEELSELKDPAKLLIANTLLLDEPSATTVADRPTPTDLVDWAYGYDIYDSDGDGVTDEARADMGDPLHTRPGAVIYGGPDNNPDLVLYATTNDGVLHAISAKADSTNPVVGGNERWSFIPRQLLNRIERLIDDSVVANRGYGLDSSVEILRLDRNGNGTIEEDGTDIDGSGDIEDDEKDRVYLFFGMRRGGSHYFGFDVTKPDNPTLMWRIGAEDAWLATTDVGFLPGIGQTWSSPSVARVDVKNTGNSEKLVLIFGGGYDTVQDVPPEQGYQPDSVGNSIYMVDALTGKLIWRAGPDAGAQLPLAKMTNAITGEVRVVDLTGDGFADRMYAADMGGRVWRFDITNGQPAASLVQGGIFASIGVADSASKPAESNRRFFSAPDVSLIKDEGQSWINVAIGSGHRERPVTDTITVNRFYSLRDYNVFTPIASTQYKASCASESTPCHQIITDANPVDITTSVNPTIPPRGAGWKLTLTRDGEKTLAESRTFQNQIYFTSFVPTLISSDPAKCSSKFGRNRLYVVDAATGNPVENFDTSVAGATDASDRSRELTQSGTIAPEAIFVFPTPDGGQNAAAVPPICLVGLESCGTGLLNPPVRTYWQQRGTN
jgi:type IV pilus assembly protein PilY1